MSIVRSMALSVMKVSLDLGSIFRKKDGCAERSILHSFVFITSCFYKGQAKKYNIITIHDLNKELSLKGKPSLKNNVTIFF